MQSTCPKCQTHLNYDDDLAGKLARCPGCGNRIILPGANRKPAADGKTAGSNKTERRGWKETDPTNPNPLLSLAIGIGALVMWFGLLRPFVPGHDVPISAYSTMQFFASLFYKHFVVSVLNTMFFTWAMAIIFLKRRKIRHQKSALLLDVLPESLGREITADNVGAFVDHVYSLPAKQRDSLMVNRIRKALELFEVRQNISDVREMMVSQSEIDSARIGGSYTLLRAFLWGIPLLGFIGTVVGLSHAIGGMNFANVEDVGKIVESINNVTSGLGTAFDATLLGLVLALTLNFPLNALSKQEDDNLHVIDAFCNEVLLPRLKEAPGASPSQFAGLAATPEALLGAFAGAQAGFLAELSQLTQRMSQYGGGLDTRMEAFQKTVTNQFVTSTSEMRERNEAAFQESMQRVEKVMGGLEAGIAELNRLLKDLNGKQVVVSAPVKKRWFGLG
ncbi:MAG: MotA/TolQ/ExbB proton channel family protein [Kiritimatiellia bacterium]